MEQELINELRQLTAAINALVQINSRLLMAMADCGMDEGEGDRTAMTYMDGTPCR